MCCTLTFSQTLLLLSSINQLSRHNQATPYFLCFNCDCMNLYNNYYCINLMGALCSMNEYAQKELALTSVPSP